MSRELYYGSISYVGFSNGYKYEVSVDKISITFDYSREPDTDRLKEFSSKAFRSDFYRYSYKYSLPNHFDGYSTLLLQYYHKYSSAREGRIEFNPNLLAIGTIKDFFRQLHLNGTDILEGVISRMDLAVDLFDIDPRGLLCLNSHHACKNSHIHHGKDCNTQYVGRKHSPLLRMYDKTMQMNQVYDYPLTSVTNRQYRLERIIKNQHWHHISDTFDLCSPFKNIEVFQVPRISNALRPFRHIIHCARETGLNAAIQDLSKGERHDFLFRLRQNHSVDWWPIEIPQSACRYILSHNLNYSPDEYQPREIILRPILPSRYSNGSHLRH